MPEIDRPRAEEIRWPPLLPWMPHSAYPRDRPMPLSVRRQGQIGVLFLAEATLTSCPFSSWPSLQHRHHRHRRQPTVLPLPVVLAVAAVFAVRLACYSFQLPRQQRPRPPHLPPKPKVVSRPFVRPPFPAQQLVSRPRLPSSSCTSGLRRKPGHRHGGRGSPAVEGSEDPWLWLPRLCRQRQSLTWTFVSAVAQAGVCSGLLRGSGGESQRSAHRRGRIM